MWTSFVFNINDFHFCNVIFCSFLCQTWKRCCHSTNLTLLEGSSFIIPKHLFWFWHLPIKNNTVWSESLGNYEHLNNVQKLDNRYLHNDIRKSLDIRKQCKRPTIMKHEQNFGNTIESNCDNKSQICYCN